MPRVSVVYLTFNQAPFVEESLRSLCEQTWDDLEVLVADDGSKDETPRVLEATAARYPGRVRLFLGEKNEGIAHNINRALLNATGEFVAFCGGDDLFLPGKVHRQVEWFRDHPRGVICSHDVEYFRDTYTLGHHSEVTPPQIGTGASALVRRGNFMHGIAVMARRAALPATGADHRLRFLNDYKLWVDALAAGGEYEILPDVLARYRRTGANVTSVHSKDMNREDWLALDLIEAEHPELARDCRFGRGQVYYRHAIWNLRDNPREARTMALKSLRLAPGPRLPALLAASLLPGPIRRALLDWRQGRSRLHS